jgi:hypothetical protein
MMSQNKLNASHENSSLLHALMNAVQSQKRGPLTERKGIMNVSTNKLVAKSTLNENIEGMKAFVPKSTAAVSLKNYLKKQVSPPRDAKQSRANKTHNQTSNNDLTKNSGSVTQRSGAEAKKSFQIDTGISMQVTCKQVKSNIPATTRAQGSEHLSYKENLQPGKDVQATSKDGNKSCDFKCMTARQTLIDDFQQNNNVPLKIGSQISIPNHEPAKCSLKSNGIVKAYAANTNQGLVRY